LVLLLLLQLLLLAGLPELLLWQLACTAAPGSAVHRCRQWVAQTARHTVMNDHSVGAAAAMAVEALGKQHSSRSLVSSKRTAAPDTQQCLVGNAAETAAAAANIENNSIR
jgi:hypothetical protein